MRIRFETTLEDMVAFNRFHYANSPAWRRQLWMQLLAVPGTLVLVLVLLGVAFLVSNGPPEPVACIVTAFCVGFPCLVLSAGWPFYIRWQASRNLVRNVRRLLAEGSNRTMYGWRELELRDGRLYMHTELLESSLDLRAIEKIVGNDEYTFVYFGSVAAYVIPMDCYPEEEFRAFVAELRDAWENVEPPHTEEWRPNRGDRGEGIIEKPW